jgi:hypothetical protein
MNHQKFNLRSWVLLVLVGLAGAGVVGAQQGPSVVTVCPQLSEGCQFTDIQDAVNATKPSDIVQIAPGIYETKDSTGAFISVMIAKSLILRGTGTNPEEVVLKANREIPVVRIEKTQNVTIENLTVRDGNGGDGGTHPNSPFPLPGELLGGGLHIKDSVSVTLRNVTVTDNLRYGLVAVNVRNLTVERSQFSRTDQSLGRRGGSGIYLESSGAIFTEIVASDCHNSGVELWGSKVEIRGSRLLTSRAYGGLSVHGLGDTASEVAIEHTVIDGNARYGVRVDGKAILRMAESKILNSSPRGELSFEGTGLRAGGSAQVFLDQLLFEGNRGEGVIVQGQATLRMMRSTIINTRDHNQPPTFMRGPCNLGRINGLGLCVAEQAQATVEQTVITGNKIGVWVFEDGRLTLKSSMVTKSNSFGIGLGSNRYRNERASLESTESVIAENANCGIEADTDRDTKITGAANTGGQANGAPDACGSAVQKIPPGFWK